MISIEALTDEIHKQNNKDIHFINFIFLINQKMKTKMNQKIIEQLNEKMETKSNIQTCCLEQKKKQKEMNDEWLKEEH